MITNKRFARERNAPLASKPKQTKAKGLKSKKIDDYLRFVLFLALIGMVYIWNSHYAAKQVRQMEVLKREAKDLKSRYLMKRANLSAQKRLVEIAATADSLGLERLKKPPFKLVRNEAVFPEPLGKPLPRPKEELEELQPENPDSALVALNAQPVSSENAKAESPKP